MPKEKDTASMVIDDESTDVNPFDDPSKLVANQDFEDLVPTKSLLLTIAVRKPGNQVFFRCHPKAEFHQEFYLLDFDEDKETYLVVPQLGVLLEHHVKWKRLYFCVTKNSTYFFWPVNANLSGNVWVDSAHQAAALAQKEWVQLVSNKDLGGYVSNIPEKSWPDPVWPECTYGELLEKSFRGRVIEDENHEVLQKLRGAV